MAACTCTAVRLHWACLTQAGLHSRPYPLRPSWDGSAYPVALLTHPLHSLGMLPVPRLNGRPSSARRVMRLSTGVTHERNTSKLTSVYLATEELCTQVSHVYFVHDAPFTACAKATAQSKSVSRYCRRDRRWVRGHHEIWPGLVTAPVSEQSKRRLHCVNWWGCLQTGLA